MLSNAAPGKIWNTLQANVSEVRPTAADQAHMLQKRTWNAIVFRYFFFSFGDWKDRKAEFLLKYQASLNYFHLVLVAENHFPTTEDVFFER